MKVLSVVVVALALASAAAAQPDPRVSVLRKQVAVLTTQVKQLQAELVAMQTQMKQSAECSYARAYKLSSGVFNYLDQLAAWIGFVKTPTTIPPYDDHGSCAALGIAP